MESVIRFLTIFAILIVEGHGNVENKITGKEDCACGQIRYRSLMSGRIMGGERVNINQLPWTVALVLKGTGVFCGATLICDRYVVTAAHCLESIASPNQLQVYLMEEDFEEENENAQPTHKIDVIEIIKHEKWSSKRLNNDITLLKLATPVSIKDSDPHAMIPACLPASNNQTYAAMEATVAGWGASAHGKEVVSKLYKVKVPIFTQDECRGKTVYKKFITDNMLCAGFLEGGRDACRGDSGGPLVIRQKSKYFLVGIVSFGNKCGKPKAPGVYARVGRYADWIREKTQDCQFCNR